MNDNSLEKAEKEIDPAAGRAKLGLAVIGSCPFFAFMKDFGLLDGDFLSVGMMATRQQDGCRLTGAADNFVRYVSKPLEKDAIVNAVCTCLAEPQARPVAVKRTTGLILIIDDSRSIVKLAEQALIKEGFDVITAFSGFEGINKAKTEHPEIIVLDIILPDTNGFAALEMIRLDSAVPVIMLTSDNYSESVKTAIGLGANGYLSKPFNARELVARVKANLSADYNLAGMARAGV